MNNPQFRPAINVGLVAGVVICLFGGWSVAVMGVISGLILGMTNGAQYKKNSFKNAFIAMIPPSLVGGAVMFVISMFQKFILGPAANMPTSDLGTVIIANVIGAPFNGLLAEKVESQLTNTQVIDGGVWAAIRDIPRVLLKELAKILSYLPLLLLVFILSLLIYPAAPIMWFGLGSWMMALQYGDYPMDNHHYSLAQVKRELLREPLTSIGFGAAVMLGSMVPLLNFLIMPAAVCGATIYWVERLQNQPQFADTFSAGTSARTLEANEFLDH